MVKTEISETDRPESFAREFGQTALVPGEVFQGSCHSILTGPNITIVSLKSNMPEQKPQPLSLGNECPLKNLLQLSFLRKQHPDTKRPQPIALYRLSAEASIRHAYSYNAFIAFIKICLPST